MTDDKQVMSEALATAYPTREAFVEHWHRVRQVEGLKEHQTRKIEIAMADRLRGLICTNMNADAIKTFRTKKLDFVTYRKKKKQPVQPEDAVPEDTMPKDAAPTIPPPALVELEGPEEVAPLAEASANPSPGRDEPVPVVAPEPEPTVIMLFCRIVRSLEGIQQSLSTLAKIERARHGAERRRNEKQTELGLEDETHG
ncbi:MAG: hypothetical protein AB7E55_32000 [Pigmentiphaga sp.]